MTTPSQGYNLQISSSHAVLRLEPEIGRAAWGDIERVGNELISSVQEEKSPAWLIDLSELEYMGSALVALVVRLWKAVQTGGGKVVVVCGHGMPEEVLRLAGLDKVWTITSTYEDGLRQLGVRAPASSTAGGGTFFVPAVLGLLLAITGGVVLGMLLGGQQLDRKIVLGGVMGGGGLAVLFGLFALIRGRAWGRALGGLAALAGIAVAVFGFLNLP